MTLDELKVEMRRIAGLARHCYAMLQRLPSPLLQVYVNTAQGSDAIEVFFFKECPEKIRDVARARVLKGGALAVVFVAETTIVEGFDDDEQRAVDDYRAEHGGSIEGYPGSCDAITIEGACPEGNVLMLAKVVGDQVADFDEATLNMRINFNTALSGLPWAVHS